MRRQSLVDERIRKPVQKRASHVLVSAHRGVHLRVKPEKADRRVDLRDEGTPEALNATLVPATGLSNLGACFWPKTHAPHR